MDAVVGIICILYVAMDYSASGVSWLTRHGRRPGLGLQSECPQVKICGHFLWPLTLWYECPWEKNNAWQLFDLSYKLRFCMLDSGLDHMDWNLDWNLHMDVNRVVGPTLYLARHSLHFLKTEIKLRPLINHMNIVKTVKMTLLCCFFIVLG